MKIDLVAEIRVEGSQFIAIHHGVNEYGIGLTLEAAIEDLLSSLAEYRASLEQRESRLSDQAMQDLQLLRKLLE